MPRKKHPRPTPEINVTPLVDVVLVLLIIFMVVIPQLDSGGAVDMPSAANVDPEQDLEFEPIQISVTAAGDIYYDKQPATRTDLINLLKQEKQVNPGRRLQIKGDKRAQYAVVRAVYADAQRVGFAGAGLAVGEKQKN